MTSRYISVADTAKLIRETLKIEFPGVTFSVRSKSYSGGASITIRWTDGPTTKRVESVVKFYEGSDFDGMIDLKSPVYHTNEGGEKIHYGADFVFCEREYSDNLIQSVAPMVAKWWDIDLPEWREAGAYWGKGYDRQWGPNLNHHLPVFTIGDAIHEACYCAEFDANGNITIDAKDNYRTGNSWIESMIAYPDSHMTHSPDYQKWEREQGIVEAPVIEPEPIRETVIAEVEQVEEAQPEFTPLPFDSIEAIEPAPITNPIAAILAKLDTDNMTPMQALQLISELKGLAA